MGLRIADDVARGLPAAPSCAKISYMQPQTKIFPARAIHTMQPEHPRATAVAVRDGRILGVGKAEDLIFWLKRETFPRSIR